MGRSLSDGTCFKKQREVAPEHYEVSARIAVSWIDVVTTSGIATGHAPIWARSRLSAGVGEAALGPGVRDHAGKRACFCAAGRLLHRRHRHQLRGDFHNLDPERLARLLAFTRSQGEVQLTA